jgi:hypothetical protein
MRRAQWPVRELVLAMLLLSVATTLRAQQWNLEAQAGKLRSTLDPNAPDAENVVLGLRYDDALTGFRVSGGVPTGSQDALWGSVAAARRLEVGRGALLGGVDFAGNAFVMRDRTQASRQLPPLGQPQPTESSGGHALAGMVMPLIGFETTRLQAQARAGLSFYSAGFGSDNVDRTVQLADVQFTFTPSPAIALIPSLRHYRADEADYTYAGATALAARGPVNAWASVGSWLNRSDESMPWALGAMVRVYDRISVNASVRHDAIDPLYLQPSQTAWNVGVSLLLGAKGNRLPVPDHYENGRATIRLPASQAASTPRIAGDFNGWKPAPMQRDGDDWTYTIPLAPGVYNYAFVDERGEWFVPRKHAGRKEDGMGGWVAVLVVEK